MMQQQFQSTLLFLIQANPNMFSISDMPSTSSVLSTYSTVAASALLVRTVFNEVQHMANQIVPKEIREKILSKLGILAGNCSSQMSLIIDEYNGYTPNQVFEDSEVYLRTKVSPSVQQLKVSKSPREKDLSVSIVQGEIIEDIYEGMQLIWRFMSSETQKTSDYEGSVSSESVQRKSFELSFNKKYKDEVLSSYLPFVMERAKAIKEEKKVIKLYSLGYFSADNDGWPWGSVNLEHPSTFDTLAMDPEIKKELKDDLDRFVRRRHFYKRIGKAWKRGYLLYGPPGTGKSSLIAAMANYLKYDIYDLELSSLGSNSELRSLIVSTKNRSILVIEDIDCSIDLENRDAGGHVNSESQLTLSGLLNFIDGLWSSCGDERIVVFTTNYKERLDPALLRPGRMDMHINMSYCTPSGFKILAKNYLGLKDHCKFGEIEKLIAEVEVTPAEVAEELMKSEDADTALAGLVAFLNKKQKKFAESDGKVEEVKKEEKKEDKEVKVSGEKTFRRSKRKKGRKCRIGSSF